MQTYVERTSTEAGRRAAQRRRVIATVASTATAVSGAMHQSMTSAGSYSVTTGTWVRLPDAAATVRDGY